MLYKKELSSVPLLPVPKIKTEKLYTVAAEILELPKSGRVLFVDLFCKKKFILRFASDGKTYQLTTTWPPDWSQRTPHCEVGRCNGGADADPKVSAMVIKFLGVHGGYEMPGVMGYIDRFCQEFHAASRNRAEQKKSDLMRQHFSMFPELPADLPEYCDRNIFERGIVFIDPIGKKGTRNAFCADCGSAFQAERSVKSGQETICPKCGAPSRFRGSWVGKDITERAKICIAYRVDGQLLIRWVEVKRVYEAHGSRDKIYRFDDYAYNLHLFTADGPKTYFYKLMPIPFTGGYWDWYRGKIGDYCYDSTYVYTNNLREVFGDQYYHVDLQRGLAGRHIQIPFAILLNNLKNRPEAEYLFKLGLPLLAASADKLKSGTAQGFQEVLGVSKQMLPMYQQMNVSLAENSIIRSYGKYVSEENLAQFRALGISTYEYDRVRRLLETMSFDRFNRYFTKQKATHKGRKIDKLLMNYMDYIDMSQALGVDLSHKSVRFPADCAAAHDQIIPRFNAVKYEAEDNLFEVKTFPIYEQYGLEDYQYGDLRMVLPRKRSDLITEGQTLNHCVGSESYFKNHIAGTRMIFFVRKAKEPEKPYFTMELDMADFRICQLYGFGDCSAPPEIRKFAERFALHVSRSKMVAAS